MFITSVALHVTIAALSCAIGVLAARQRRVVPQLVERARHSAREYERARRDYEQLVRHRIGNPLAVVQGVAHTLDAYPQLAGHTRQELVRSLVVAADELTRVSLDPGSISPEEHELRAVPAMHVDEPRGVRPSGTPATYRREAPAPAAGRGNDGGDAVRDDLPGCAGRAGAA